MTDRLEACLKLEIKYLVAGQVCFYSLFFVGRIFRWGQSNDLLSTFKILIAPWFLLLAALNS